MPTSWRGSLSPFNKKEHGLPKLNGWQGDTKREHLSPRAADYNRAYYILLAIPATLPGGNPGFAWTIDDHRNPQASLSLVRRLALELFCRKREVTNGAGYLPWGLLFRQIHYSDMASWVSPMHSHGPFSFSSVLKSVRCIQSVPLALLRACREMRA